MFSCSPSTYLERAFALLSIVLICWQCKVSTFSDHLPFEQYVAAISDSLKANKPDAALALVQCLLEDKLEARQKAEALFLKGIAHKTRSAHKQALTDFQAVKKILDKTIPGDDSLKAETLHQIGLGFGALPNFDSAMYYHQAALDMKVREFKTEVHVSVIRSYNDLAGTFAGRSEEVRSLEMRKHALRLAKQLPIEEEEVADLVIRLHSNIGRLHFIMFNLAPAMDYYQDGLAVALKEEPKHFELVIMLYLNLAQLSISNHKYDLALDYTRRADAVYTKYAPNQERNTYWMVAGDVHRYKYKDKPDTALYYYRLNHAIQTGKPTVNQRLVAVSHGKLAEVFFQSGRYDSCLFHVNRQLEIEALISGKEHGPHIDSYRLIGWCYKALGKSEESVQAFQQMLRANNYHGDLKTISRYEYALWGFHEIAQVRYDQHLIEKNPDLLIEGLQNCKLADEAAVLKRRLLRTSESKEMFSQFAKALYETAVIICEALYQATSDKKYVAEAFHFSERSKSLNLSDAIKDDQAAYEAAIPEKYIARENELKKEIAWKKSFRGGQLNEKDAAHQVLIAQTDQDIHTLETALDSLIQLYRDSFPAYFNQKFANVTVTAAEVQAYCRQQQTTVLSYFFAKGNLYTFIIQPEGFEMEAKALPTNFEKTFNRFQNYIAEVPPIEASDTAINNRLQYLAKNAHLLYQALIPDQKHLLQKRLMIIPDGLLAYLPFSVLLKKPVPEQDLKVFNEWPYLVKTYAIAYCYSATLLRQMEQKKHREQPANNFLGVAPDFSGKEWSIWAPPNRTANAENIRLSYNIQEVENLHRYMSQDGDLLLTNDLATRDNLTRHGPYYRILHFSTHAFAFSHGDDDPFLALRSLESEGALTPFYLREVLHLRLNADLVVLSACRTGLGRFSRTEGLISLGQAFAYAGAKSISPTLWNIKDSEANVILMQFFYENLCFGLPKDQAMQKAQLDFLAQDKYRSSGYADPHYWAAFSCIGDRSPLSF
ncbi:MAG: CHAT domain-containing protein [Saprospiraceae bacterium]